jgi:hypothetical protein
VLRCRTFHLLLGNHVEERLEVRTELLFLRGCWLQAGPKEYDCCSEVQGGSFGDGSPVNVVDDAAACFLCALMCGHYRGLRVEHVVELRMLVLKSLLSLVQLVEARLLPLAVVPVMRRFLTSRCVGKSGLTFRGAIVGVGGVYCVGLLLEDETLALQVVGRQRLLVERRAFGLVTACLRSPRGDWRCVSRGSGIFHPTAGEPRLPLRVHRVVVELEFVQG